MNKPFSMMCEEFKEELASLINNSGLPVCVIELTLQNYLNEVNSIAKNQYRIDKAQYENSLKNEENQDALNER